MLPEGTRTSGRCASELRGGSPCACDHVTTVLLHVLEPVNVRNMLRCGVLEHIRRSDPTAVIVIVSPLAEQPGFREEFAGPDVRIEYAPWYRLNRLERRLDSLALERFVRTRPTRALTLRWARRENVGTRRLQTVTAMLKRVSGHVPIPLAPLLSVRDRLVPGSSYRDVLERHRPDVAAIATGWQVGDIPWFVGPRRAGIPCLAIDINWDSFESKAGIIRGASELLVWSEHLRAKAIARFRYSEDRVHVTGAPQFDIYRTRAGGSDRSSFLARLGFPPETRLITLATVMNSPHDPDRLRVLHRALLADEFGPDARLLVRVYPADRRERWEPFRALPRAHIEWPFSVGPEGLLLGERREDMRHKLDTLLHTDVLVNVNSTIALEAMLVDTPTVMVAFDGEGGELPYARSDRRFLDYEHISELVATGGVRVVRSPTELVAGIRGYLADPTSDREGRARAGALTGPADGRAAERVAGHLLRAAATRESGLRSATS